MGSIIAIFSKPDGSLWVTYAVAGYMTGEP